MAENEQQPGGHREKATMGQVKSIVRRRNKRRPEHEETSLNIYPMMDMMTILLVFLIVPSEREQRLSAAARRQRDDLELKIAALHDEKSKLDEDEYYRQLESLMLELARGKTGRVYGHLLNLLTMLKGLPLSYNRDLQEDKPALFDALDTVTASLRVMTELMRRLKVNREALSRALQGGGLLATELADYLVLRGVPFREAHGITGRIVRAAVDRGQDITDLSLEELQAFSDRIGKDVFSRLTTVAAIDHKGQVGGTARVRVEERIKELEKMLS